MSSCYSSSRSSQSLLLQFWLLLVLLNQCHSWTAAPQLCGAGTTRRCSTHSLPWHSTALFARKKRLATAAKPRTITVTRIPANSTLSAVSSFAAPDVDSFTTAISTDEPESSFDDLSKLQVNVLTVASVDKELEDEVLPLTSTPAAATAASTAAATAEAEILKARLLLMAAAALYGTNFSLVKMMGETAQLPIGLSTTLRFGLAAFATLPWLFLPTHGKDHKASAIAAVATQDSTDGLSSLSAWWSSIPPEVGAAIAGFEVGLWNSIGYISQAVGLETTLASKSAFLCSMAVVTVPLLDYLFRQQKLLPRQIAGILLAIVGVGALELGDVVGELLSGGPLISSGDLISMIQPLAFGMGFWRMEHAMHKYRDQANRSTAAQLLAVFTGAATYCALTEHNLDWSQLQVYLHDPLVWFALFWTGVVTTALTVYMETLALKTLTASETTLIMSTEPVSGAAFAAAVMGERFGPASMLGSVFILAGCLYSNLGLDGIKSFFKRNGKDNKSKVQSEP